VKTYDPADDCCRRLYLRVAALYLAGAALVGLALAILGGAL
jgi:hypothetical protein